LTLQRAVNVASPQGDTINIEAGTYVGSTTINGKHLTILGPGASHAILKWGGDPITSVIFNTFSFVTISGVTFTQSGISAIENTLGNLALENCVVSDSVGTGVGGGITNKSGSLTLIGTTVTNNEAGGKFGGGVANVGGVTTISSVPMCTHRLPS